MDAIASAVAALGVNGAVVAAALYYLPRAVAKLQEQRDQDSAWLRLEIDRKRAEYLEAASSARAEFVAALRDVAAENSAAIERSEGRWQAVVGEITAEIRALRDEVRAGRPSVAVTDRPRPQGRPARPTDETGPWEVG